MTFNPKAKAAPYISLEVKMEAVTPAHSEAGRLEDAKTRALDLFKRSNPADGSFGPSYHPSFYKDFQGPESSWYSAAHLIFKMRLTETKFRGRNIPINLDEAYNPRTGIFHIHTGPLFSLQDLKEVFAARIAELGVSEILLTEWLAVVHNLK